MMSPLRPLFVLVLLATFVSSLAAASAPGDPRAGRWAHEGTNFKTKDGVSLPLTAGHADATTYGIRPEHLHLDPNGIPAEVIVVEPTGSETQVLMRLGTQQIVGIFRERISAGMVSINNSTSGAEAHLPFGGNGKSGNGSRQSGIWVLDQFTRWQSMNWDYAGKLQKAQMDLVEIEADKDFRLEERAF